MHPLSLLTAALLARATAPNVRAQTTLTLGATTWF